MQPEDKTAYKPLRVIAAGDDRSQPAQPPISLGGPGFDHPSDCDDAQTEWDGGPYPAAEPGVYDIGERHGVTRPAEDAPFPDGWPSVPSLTVTLDGRACLSAPLVNDRQSFDVGPYKVWITL